MAAAFALMFHQHRERLKRLFAYSELATDATFAAKGMPLEVVAMFEAAVRGDVPILRDALRERVPVDVRDGAGQTPLLLAASRSLEATRWLVEHGADVDSADLLGEFPLLRAARSGSADTVRYLIGRGADLEGHHVEGWTPLIAAALRGREDIVAALLEAGANVSAQTIQGFTAESCARAENRDAVLALLASRNLA